MNPIKEETKIEDILEEYPQLARVFTQFGLPLITFPFIAIFAYKKSL